MTTHPSRAPTDLAVGPRSAGLRKRVFQSLEAPKQWATYPKGSTLLRRGQPVSGIFVLLAGRVKLSISSPRGTTVILGIARPREILGLSAAIAGTPSEVSAQTIMPSRLCFIPRDEFLHNLHRNSRSCLHVVQLLSGQLRDALELIGIIGRAQSTRKKLATLLLAWANSLGVQTERGIELESHLNAEEIGQMIGATRETVSRLLAAFKRNQILSVKGSTFCIRKKASLEDLAATKRRRTAVPQTHQGEGTSRLQQLPGRSLQARYQKA